MDANIFQTLSIVGFSCMAVFLVIAIILFFVFDIPAVLGELSGKTAAKKVAEIREQNRKPVTKRHTVNGYDALLRTQEAEADNRTEPLEQGTVMQKPEGKMPETVPLDPETELLTEGAAFAGETVLLQEEKEPIEGTTLLSAAAPAFELVQNIVVIHTNEMI